MCGTVKRKGCNQGRGGGGIAIRFQEKGSASAKNPRYVKDSEATNPEDFNLGVSFRYRVTSKTPELDIRFDDLTGTWRERMGEEELILSPTPRPCRQQPTPSNREGSPCSRGCNSGRSASNAGVATSGHAPWGGDQQCVGGTCLLLRYLPGSPGTGTELLDCSIYQGLACIGSIAISPDLCED